jgi:hypothetical protein
MAPNVTVSFFDPADINGTPILTITDEDTFLKGLKLTPDLNGLGGWELTLARAWGFALFGSGAVDPEVFVRFMVHAWSDTNWYYGGVLQKRELDVIQRDEIGAEELVIGGPGPKQYLDRYRLGTQQHIGTGWNLDLTNGVWRWNESATSGRILNKIFDEAAAAVDEALPDLTRSFSSTVDTNGTTWADTIADTDTYEIPIGTSALQAIWDLEDLSDLYTWIDLGTESDPTYLLNAAQSYGSDVSGSSFGAGVGLLREGVNIANDSLTVSGVGIRKANHVIVEGKDGTWKIAVKPTWSSGNYVKWAKIEYTRSSNEDILEKAGLRWIRRQDNGDQQITVEILPGASEATGLYFPAPDGPIWLGNTIALDTTADGSTHSPLDYNNADQLVTGLELDLGPAGSDASADAKAKSWDIKVKLNMERAGFSGSPSQSSASSSPGNGAGGGCKCPPLCHVDVPGTPPSETVTPVKAFNADSDGGDTLTWTGILSNQAGGAAGTSHYYFKASSPEEWSNTIAVSAGVTVRISGWVKDVAGTNGFKIGFFNQAAGSTGNNANKLAEHVLSTGHSGWVYASADYVTPASTTSFCIGKQGTACSFDEIRIGTVVSDPGTGGIEGDVPEPVGSEGASGTSARAARCDHVHASDGVAEGHITDTADAHDASAISVLDTGSNFTATDVEGALAEIQDRIDALPSGTGIGEILISDTPSTPLVFADLIQNEAQDDLVYGDP